MLASVYAPKDFKRLRVVGDLVARCFDFITPHIHAGVSTGEIDRLVAGFLKENGARSFAHLSMMLSFMVSPAMMLY